MWVRVPSTPSSLGGAINRRTLHRVKLLEVQILSEAPVWILRVARVGQMVPIGSRWGVKATRVRISYPQPIFCNQVAQLAVALRWGRSCWRFKSSLGYHFGGITLKAREKFAKLPVAVKRVGFQDTLPPPFLIYGLLFYIVKLSIYLTLIQLT